VPIPLVPKNLLVQIHAIQNKYGMYVRQNQNSRAHLGPFLDQRYLGTHCAHLQILANFESDPCILNLGLVVNFWYRAPWFKMYRHGSVRSLIDACILVIMQCVTHVYRIHLPIDSESELRTNHGVLKPLINYKWFRLHNAWPPHHRRRLQCTWAQLLYSKVCARAPASSPHTQH